MIQSGLARLATTASRGVGGILTPHQVPLARHMSSRGPQLKSYPSHSVFGENCILSLQMMPPGFKVLKNRVLAVDSQKTGRLILEFVPRTGDGKFNRDGAIRFGLSAEEAAVIIEKSKTTPIQLYRIPPSYGMTDTSEVPEKVLHILPGNSNGNGSVLYKVDYELNGVGGQVPVNLNASNSQLMAMGPLEVTVQLGEHLVMLELMRHALPIVTGWSTRCDTAMKAVELDAIQNQDRAHSDGMPF